MFAKYAPILALTTAAFAAPLVPAACPADVPIVTVTTYVTGYPPASTASSSTPSELPPVPSPVPGAFYEVGPKPPAYGAPSSPGTTTTEPAKPNPPKTTATSSSAAPPPPPPPPVATYNAAPQPPTTTTSTPSNPKPTYAANPPPPPPPPPSDEPTYGAPPPKGGSGTYSMTPHQQFSSSVGVLGCKINTNRVAYWPMYPDVTRYCVKVTYKGRSLHLLHIDQSGGAYDISYDAWNYLATGKSATESPHCGGGINMQYEWVDNHACADLIHDPSGKMPISASNPDLAIAAPEPKDKYVTLYNFKDLKCAAGADVVCPMPDYAAGETQAKCPGGLGMVTSSTGIVLEDIPYSPTANCPVPE